MAPLDRAVVGAWINDLMPPGRTLIAVRPWRYQNPRGAAAGRANVRIAPPDTLRFDYRGPFGRSGAALVIGSDAVWVEPEEEFGSLVDVAPVLWAALGLPPMPPAGAVVRGLDATTARAWSYVVGGDSITMVLDGSPVARLRSEIRRQGRAIAVSDLRLDSAGRPVESHIDFPLEQGRFSFQIESVTEGASFPDAWIEP